MIFKKSTIKRKKEEIAAQELVSKINEDEAQQAESNVIELSYTRAKFWKRCSIILFDFICCFLVTLGSFIGIKAIADSTASIKNSNSYLNQKREESGLYYYYKAQHRYLDLIDFYNTNKEMDASAKVVKVGSGIEKFFTMIDKELGKNEADALRIEYDQLKLSEKMNKKGTPLFVKKDEKIIINPSNEIQSKDVYEIFFTPYIKEKASGYFVTKIPNVLETQKYLSNILLFVELPISIFIGFTIIYYIVPLCFYRGKQTFGRALFQTGLVDKNVLSVSFGKFTARFCIMLFAEVFLSILTLGVPLFVSFSLMAFSKKKQLFHDYMLGIEEVDISCDKIYKNLDELVEKPLDYDIENFKPIQK